MECECGGGATKNQKSPPRHTHDWFVTSRTSSSCLLCFVVEEVLAS